MSTMSWSKAARALLTVAVAAGALVAAASPRAAQAHTPRVEAESGTIRDPDCASDGERMSVQPGGTGEVVFFPHYGCALEFAGNDLRYHPTTIHYWATGASGPICGLFWWGGAVSGESERVCSAPGEPVVARITVEQRRLGAYTLYWMPDAGHRYANAYVDYVENTLADTLVEAEWAPLESCAGGTMSRVWDGTNLVVAYPGAGCGQTYPQLGRYVLDTISYYHRNTNYTTVCGYFAVTGSITGRSETVCAGEDVPVTARFTTTNVGTGDYTVTWTPTGGNSWVGVRVDSHTRVRTRTVEAETGWFHNGDTCAEDPAHVDGDVAVYTGMGCRQVFSVDTPVVVDSVTVHLADGDGGPTCGWFDFVGAVNGGSDEFCAAPGEVVNVRVRSSFERTGAVTLTWFAALDGSPWVDAHVDSFTVVPAVVEAETATTPYRTCGGDTTTGPTGGTAYLFAGDGCAAALVSPGSTVVTSARVMFRGLPATNVCGYFAFSGAVTGRSDTRCVDLMAGADTWADLPVHTTSAGRVGGSYTVTWRTTTGTLPTTDALVDRLTLASG